MRAATLVLVALCLRATPLLASGVPTSDLKVIATASIGGPLAAAPARTTAVISAYSNFTNETGWAYLSGGATLVGANTITRMVEDDIVPLPAYAGLDVTQFRFTVINFNGVDVTCRLHFRFYAADGPGGLPGTVLWAFDGPGRTFAASTEYLFTKLLSAGQFQMPGSPFWAGLSFDDINGTSGATADQLNLMGQVAFGPPTVGSTSDFAFQSDNAGSFDSGFPAGSTFNSIGCVCPPAPAPVPASFGWEFDVDGATPTHAVSWGRLKNLYR